MSAANLGLAAAVGTRPNRQGSRGATASRASFPETEITVRFHELDPYGHVNHGVYPNYFETARIDALDHLGLGIDALRDRGVHLIVVEIRLVFRAPAVARDDLRVVTSLTELRPASSWWHQELVRADDRTLIATADVRTATAGPDGRPKPPPQEVLDLVRPYAP